VYDVTRSDVLHVVSFFFTIILIGYGLIKGLDTIELWINMGYFFTLIIMFLDYYFDRKVKK